MATGYTLCGRGAAWATINLGPEGLRVASRTACSPRGLRTTAWVPHGTLSRSELVRREGDACEGRGHGGTDCAGVLLVGPERVVGQWRAERPSVGCYTRPQSTDPGLVSQSAETRWQRVCDNGVTTACAAVSECGSEVPSSVYEPYSWRFCSAENIRSFIVTTENNTGSSLGQR